MRYIFVTLFPNLIEPYFQDSILKRAIDQKLLEIEFVNPRDFAKDRHQKVDEYLCGGGAGLLMKPEPLFLAIESILERVKEAHIVFPTPVGKKFTQNDSKRLAKKRNIIFVSGRYEGIDERVIEEFADELLSIGDYILTGGEISSLVLADSISRNIEGVLGNSSSLEEESFNSMKLEAPAFTKPNIYRKNEVVSEYLKGNHSKISSLKNKFSDLKTKYYRFDMYQKLKIRKFYEK